MATGRSPSCDVPVEPAVDDAKILAFRQTFVYCLQTLATLDYPDLSDLNPTIWLYSWKFHSVPVPLLSAGVFIFEQSLFGMIHRADEHVCATGSKTVRVVVLISGSWGGAGWGEYQPCLWLRYMIFTCTSCYFTWFSLALSWSSLALHAMLKFQRAERFRNRALSVHTGTIDSCWKQMKTHIPKSLSSQSKQIPLRIRSWQWRFTHAEHDDLFQLCGTQVAKLYHCRQDKSASKKHSQLWK